MISFSPYHLSHVQLCFQVPSVFPFICLFMHLTFCSVFAVCKAVDYEFVPLKANFTWTDTCIVLLAFNADLGIFTNYFRLSHLMFFFIDLYIWKGPENN